MSRFYNKDIKMLVNLLQTLKMFQIVCSDNFGEHSSSRSELFYGFVKFWQNS